MSGCCSPQDACEFIIIQGTTPPLTLYLDCDLSKGYDIRVAIKYTLTDYFIFTNDDMYIEPLECGCCIEIRLTQEQTLAMKNFIIVQLKAKEKETGNVIESKEVRIDVLRTLDRTVMQLLINMDIGKNPAPIRLGVSNCKPSSGGTSNYNDLRNKPILNGVTIQGNKSSEDYGIYGVDAPETFVYEQKEPAATWTIKHNLNKYPSITVVDSAGTVVMGEYNFVDKTTITCTFSGAFSGICYLN